MNTRLTTLAAAVLGASALAACAGMNARTPVYSQSALSAALQVPAGNKVAMETAATGLITYECRAKAGMAGQFEWVFVGPEAKLVDRSGKPAGRYYGPPATWESLDGSRLTATQVAVAPGMAGAIPLQLVKANPAIGAGMMQGVSYIQRVGTRGGVAPSTSCGQDNVGARQVVNYSADYIFYKAS